MPIRFRYFPDRGLLVHVGFGQVTLDDIRDVRRARREAGVPPSVPRTLSDMRQARFDLDPGDLQKNEERTAVHEYSGQRHAEIVGDPSQTAILMLWRTWTPDEVEVEIFSTPEAGYAWLGVEPREGDLDL